MVKKTSKSVKNGFNLNLDESDAKTFRIIPQNSHRSSNIPPKATSFKEKKNKSVEIAQIKEELKNFARTSWGQKWVNAILEFGRPYRMQRGIRYALEERISHLTISPGLIFATVQGTAPTPYRVKLLFDSIQDKGWRNIIHSIAQKAKYIIYLLENKMPDDLEEIFTDAGFSLFPSSSGKMNYECSCPDANHDPNKITLCKHIAATALYVARVLDYDPFLILKLRGKGKEEILRDLQIERSCSNEPITQSIKNIRKIAYPTTDSFEFPSISISELYTTPFSLSEEATNIGFQFSPPSASIETLDNLGNLPNIDNPDSFKLTLRDLYLGITKQIYKMAMSLEEGSTIQKKELSKKK